MRYVSTRGGMAPSSFQQVLLEGLAPDGGLVVPESYPRLLPGDLSRFRALDYADLAFEIIALFVDDIPPDDLRALTRRTYTAAVFGTDDITPVAPLFDNLHLVELSNGPTLAFKDLAMQFLGHLFEYVIARTCQSITVVGATSGDTGSSAVHAMAGKAGVRVVMLSPLGKTSPFQAAQMYSVLAPNIVNVAVRGVFDDCQDLVKAVNADADFKRRHRLTAVNSINWARVVAQVVYYVKGYLALDLDDGEEISVAVPTGNFGNILAGHIARMIGVPIAELILATNENDVLDEFFRTGRYRVRPSSAVHATSSPSMDISKASNFERFVFDLTGRDATATCELFARVEREGGFDLAGTPYMDKLGDYRFVSGFSTHADRLDTIRLVHQRTGRLIDTHTADGVKVALERGRRDLPMLCLETASPAKFADAIQEAIGRLPPRPPGYEGLEDLPQRVETIECDLDALKAIIEVG